MPLEHTTRIRFYGPLKDFLQKPRQGRRFAYVIKGCPSIKDTIEAIGVPHTAVAAIRINGNNADFSFQLKEGDRIDVYPFIGQRPLKSLRPPPINMCFVVDSHLGKLAKSLRLLGFDTLYENTFADPRIVALAVKQKRIVLSRDIGLLKNKKVTWGYWVRSTEAKRQMKEVILQYDLGKAIKPFSRCLECNGLIKPVPKAEVLEVLPPKVKKFYTRFYHCRDCGHIYWEGSHYEKLERLVRKYRILTDARACH